MGVSLVDCGDEHQENESEKEPKEAKAERFQEVQRKARLAAGKKTTAKSNAVKSKPAKHKVSRKKKIVRSTAAVRRKSQSVETVSLEPKGLGTRAGVGSGNLQGISILENVDSESAEELLEEGQAFEAGVISGVEDAPDADKSEVTTHEVPQDDVPGEYYDKDRP
jgi:hypothetical protein